MFDLHCHILPGVDDGADTMEIALEMARISVESGVEFLVATPHANLKGYKSAYCSYDLQKLFEKLVLMLDLYDINLKVIQGMEIFASDDIVSLIKNKQVCPMGGSNYYLVEFPFGANINWVNSIINQMLNQGFLPIIAHPERYLCLKQNIDVAYKWHEIGCKLQLNSGSLIGDFGSEATRVSLELLKNNLVDCVGSDAHGVFERSTKMTQFLACLDTYIPHDQKTNIVTKYPKKMLGINF